MPMAERMKLAEGRPLRRRMMAAMAQQDCGQCGYNCHDYSEALFRQVGSAPQSLRARRQGNRPHAEVPHEEMGGAGRQGACGCAGRSACTGADRSTGPLARQSRRGDVSVAQASQQGGLGERHLASRVRPRRVEARLRGRRLVRCLSAERSGAGRDHDRRRSACRRISRSAANAARSPHRTGLARARAGLAVPAVLLHHRRRAAAEGEGAGVGRGSRWRCGNPRRARGTGEVPASSPIRKPSSRCWSRCSRVSTPSRRRRNADAGRVSLTVDTVRYASRIASGSASPRHSSPTA